MQIMKASHQRLLKRREFLRHTLAGATALGLPAWVHAETSHQLAGKLLGVTLQHPENPSEEKSSILELDLASGAVHYHELPDHRLGHSLVMLPDGGYFAVPYGDDDVSCLFLDEQFRATGEVKPPTGHGYAGHATLLPDGRHLFGHFNQSGYGDEEALDPDQTGQRYVVDRITGEVVETKATSILHAHDILLTRDQTHVIVGDDGTLSMRMGDTLKASDDPFALTPGTPQIVVFNAKDLAEVRRIPLDINGALVHLTEDREGRIVGASEQFVANNEAGLKALRDLLGDDVPMYVDHLNEALIKLGVELPYPGPLVRVNPESGDVATHLAPYHQMPFDVDMNRVTGRVFHVFTASGMMARFDPLKKSWGYFSTEPYGIQQPYSVTDIPGTSFMAINGFLEGVAVFDTLTMRQVIKFDTHNFGIKHIQYRA